MAHMSVSPSPFGLDFGTLDFGTSDSGLTINMHLDVVMISDVLRACILQLPAGRA